MAALDNFGYRYMRYNRPQIGVFMDMNCIHTEYFIDEVKHYSFSVIKVLLRAKVKYYLGLLSLLIIKKKIVPK